VVNALSEWVEVTVWRDKKAHIQGYERGKPTGDLETKQNKEKRTGTSVQFLPDQEIFSTGIEFDYNTIIGRLRELAYLNAGVKITITDHRLELLKSDEPRIESYCYEGGIKEYVTYMNREKQSLHEEVIFVRGEKNDVQVEVALQWCVDAFSDNVLGFANNIRTVDGGTHLEGLKTVLTRTMNGIARKRNKLKDSDANLGGENVREGLTAVISVKVPEPEFEGQTKTKLGNTEVRGIVDSLVGEVLTEYLDFNPQVADAVLEKAIQAFKAAEAARRARDLVRRKSVLESSPLPGKLADCSTKNPEESEIYLVEGDSASGCFAGSQRVILADGRRLSFAEIVAEQAEGKEHFCYTINQSGNVAIEKIVNARITKKNATVIKINLDNNETIICTPDHLFMLRNGSYKPAALLTKNDSLMPLYQKLSQKPKIGQGLDSYKMVWDPQKESWIYTDLLADFYNLKAGVYESGDGDYPRHVDFNKLNNPTNTQGLLSEKDLEFQRTNLEFIYGCSEGNEFSGRDAIRNYNHRVVSIEPLEEQLDVYDIEVPNTHNFALASGVFVHNSAKQGRDRRFQAILPLRGKIINIEKTDDAKIYKNNEIQSMITALGLGIKGDEFDASQLRYHKVIIMTDADVDGSHIRTLLLTFFYRYQRALVDQGYIYIACPPLYKVERGRNHYYCYSDNELSQLIENEFPDNANYTIQRFKGLGEMMPVQLWDTTMNPETRTLKRVEIEDAAEADRIFTVLMGDRVAPRREFIETYGPKLKITDLDI
ncbi:MAG: toprim domain-containing protein, partial [Trichodesmium sp. St19_bin1]|nr:toprim domain-containing protein [Trichodesmium sp. St19_bin1]